MTELNRHRVRKNLTARVHRLGEEPGDDLSATTSPEARLEMVTVLSARMWALTGLPTPEYSRAEMPGRVLRTG
ncbi:MAG: hypothetical protein SGI84_01410 [Gemmatimonadota bacterium]|nr:hypothetical protein [Gemmatimonadota bacterium]